MGFGDWLSDVAKGVPGVGHVYAVVQLATGDTDGARRTVATATGNLVATVATVAGSIGGPPGAMLAGAAGSVVGNMIERGINGEHIETDPGRIALQAVTGAASGLTGGGAGALTGGATKIAGQAATRTAIGAATTTTIVQGVDSIRRGNDSRDRSADQGDGTGENQVRVVGPLTAAKARDFETYYANELRDPLLLKLQPRDGSLADLIGNTTPVSFWLLQIDNDWTQANTEWQKVMAKWTAGELKERLLKAEDALSGGVKMSDIEAKFDTVDEKRKEVTKTLNEEAVYKPASLAKVVPSFPF